MFIALHQLLPAHTQVLHTQPNPSLQHSSSITLLHPPRLRSSDSPPLPLTPLPTAQVPLLPLHSLATLLHDLLALRQDELNVARQAHVRVDAAVGAVRAAALLGRLVHLDVLDEEVGGVEAFGVGIGFGVAEEVEDVLGGLFGPAGTVGAEGLACA